MKPLSDQLTDEKRQDLKVLADFIRIFCEEKHARRGEAELCAECGQLLAHAKVKLLLCPYDPKPKCKHCQTHCYAPAYRARIKEVMKFSGMHLLKKGRLDLLANYFF